MNLNIEKKHDESHHAQQVLRAVSVASQKLDREQIEKTFGQT